MTAHSTYLDDGRLFLRVWPAPEPRGNVLLAHGYAEHSGRYGHVAEALGRAGFSVWAPDHHGHGQSAGQRGDIESWERVVTDLDLVMKEIALEGAGPTFLVGHSLGGPIAIAYALEHQHRLAGLSLSAPALIIPPEMLAMAELPEIPLIDVAAGVCSDAAVVEDYRNDPLNYLGPMPRNLLVLLSRVSGLVDKLGEITIPVQVMCGSADALLPNAVPAVVGGISSTDVSARIWPGLFHEIFNETRRDEVVEELTRWLTARVPPGDYAVEDSTSARNRVT